MARYRRRRNGPGIFELPKFTGWLDNPDTPPEFGVGDMVLLRTKACTLFVTVQGLEGEQYRGQVFTSVGGASGVWHGDAVTFTKRNVFPQPT